MPLYTWEERFAQLQRELYAARKAADDAARYAENSARLHHEAICRLHQMITGEFGWPPRR
jgi:hypothetical protein